MTVIIKKSKFNLREALNTFNRKFGLFGQQILSSENSSDFYEIVGTNRNKIINGNFIISQRYGSSSVTGEVGYPIDRWNVDSINRGSFNFQQSFSGPPGFKNCLIATTSSSFTPTSYNFLNHHIEGIDIADLAWGTASAKPVTLSFWIYASIPGRYSVAITNSQNLYAFPTYVDVGIGSTWEYKTVTIPGPTTGTWNTDIGTVGLRIKFNLGSGSNFESTANVWTAADKAIVPGSVGLSSYSSATLRLTGVQLEKGTVATPFEFRSYQKELALCQRFYQVHQGWSVGRYDSGASGSSFLIFKPTVPFAVQPPSVVIAEHSTSANRNVYASGGSYVVGDGSYTWNSGSAVGSPRYGWVFHGTLSNLPQGSYGYAPGLVIGFSGEI